VLRAELGRRDADHQAEPGSRPHPAGLGQYAGLPGPGRCVDHRDAFAVREHRQDGRRLILAQPSLRARLVRSIRAAGQHVLEPGQVRAERPRGRFARQARRAVSARLREHAFFHGQLPARGVAHSPVPLVDAAPVGAQQAARRLDGFGCFQAQDWLEL